MQPGSLAKLMSEQTAFRLFRCKDGCFHLEWKYFGIVHMTLFHLVRVYEQLMKAIEQPQPGDIRLHVECNDDVELKLTGSEARALMSQVESIVHGQVLPQAGNALGYIM